MAAPVCNSEKKPTKVGKARSPPGRGRFAACQIPPTDVVAKLDRIYDLRRNCLMNELYYGRRLSEFTRISLWLETWIVIGSGASGVSGWVIWTTYPEFRAGWAAVAAIATLLATLKPVLHIDARIKRYSVLFASYRQLSISMAAVVEDIAEDHRVSQETERDVNRVRTRYRSLAVDDDPKPFAELVRQLHSEVNVRVPTSSLFYPPSMDTSYRQAEVGQLEDEAVALGVRINPAEPWSTDHKDHPT
jgi:hypothetical protein